MLFFFPICSSNMRWRSASFSLHAASLPSAAESALLAASICTSATANASSFGLAILLASW